MYKPEVRTLYLRRSLRKHYSKTGFESHLNKTWNPVLFLKNSSPNLTWRNPQPSRMHVGPLILTLVKWYVCYLINMCRILLYKNVKCFESVNVGQKLHLHKIFQDRKEIKRTASLKYILYFLSNWNEFLW